VERKGREKVGIPEARHAVGILVDVNQVLVTVRTRSDEIVPGSNSDDVTNSGRGFCYTYRYALCSTSGFTAGAQAYALAHQIALLDLSHGDYDEMRKTVDAVGDVIHRYMEKIDRGIRGDSPITRNRLLRKIRATLRQQLWGVLFENADDEFLPMLKPLISATGNIGELFVGVSATGFVILLKADYPDRMIRHMRAPTDPFTSIHYEEHDDGSLQWQITVSSERANECKLSFVLPDAMLRVLEEKREGSRRVAALDLKEQHFSRITVYRMTDTKSMICSLKLDGQWLARARQELDRRTSRKPPA
jgi:hypothetical protein